MYQVDIVNTVGDELVTLEEAKNYCRIDTSADDTLIELLIASARQQIESYLSRDIVAKDRSLFLDYTDGNIYLPWGPIDIVTAVYIDSAMTTDFTTIGIKEINVLLGSGPAKLVQVLYTTLGMNDAAIKQAMLQLISTLYENRADFKTGTIVSTIDTTTKVILAGFKNVFI